MRIGKAWIKKKKIFFDAAGWALVLQHAKKSHQSPKTVVQRALIRGIRKYRGNHGL